MYENYDSAVGTLAFLYYDCAVGTFGITQQQHHSMFLYKHDVSTDSVEIATLHTRRLKCRGAPKTNSHKKGALIIVVS